MIKQLLILAVVAGALVIGGVLEVKVHPSELTQVPGRVSALVRNPEVLGKIRIIVVNMKRWGEQAIARDEEKKLELALLYIKEDVARLRTLQEEEDTAPSTVHTQAQQLTRSLALAETSLRAVPVETVLKMQERSQASVTTIREALQQLQRQRDAQEEAQKSFADTVAALESKFSAFSAVVGSGGQQSSVAGTQDEESPAPSATPTSAIPLKF